MWHSDILVGMIFPHTPGCDSSPIIRMTATYMVFWDRKIPKESRHLSAVACWCSSKLSPSSKNSCKIRVLQDVLPSIAINTCTGISQVKAMGPEIVTHNGSERIQVWLPSLKLTWHSPWKSPCFLGNTIKMVDVPWLCSFTGMYPSKDWPFF